MKTALRTLTTGLAAFALAGPVLADDDHRGHRDGRGWHDDRDHRDHRGDSRNQATAYRDGFRDGVRADNRWDHNDNRYRQGPSSYRPYVNGSRWDNRSYRTDNRYAYRGNSASSPYWWGSNGQVHCRRQDGTTGLVVGALAGGTLGNVIAREGDKRLGSVIGGTLGAVLGNELAKGNVRCR